MFGICSGFECLVYGFVTRCICLRLPRNPFLAFNAANAILLFASHKFTPEIEDLFIAESARFSDASGKNAVKNLHQKFTHKRGGRKPLIL